MEVSLLRRPQPEVAVTVTNNNNIQDNAAFQETGYGIAGSGVAFQGRWSTARLVAQRA